MMGYSLYTPRKQVKVIKHTLRKTGEVWYSYTGFSRVTEEKLPNMKLTYCEPSHSKSGRFKVHDIYDAYAKNDYTEFGREFVEIFDNYNDAIKLCDELNELEGRKYHD